MDIEQCYFHNIRETLLFSSSDIFEHIIMSKAVLTHASMDKKNLLYKRGLNYQGDDGVSLCFHPKNLVMYERMFNPKTTDLKESKAFKLFILDEDTPTIIFSPKITSDLTLRSGDNYQRMPDEIQIVGDIPLNYMVGIGYNDRINYYHSLVQKLINNSTQITDEEIWDIRSFITRYEGNGSKMLDDKRKEIDYINGLLDRHKYNVPIVNVYNGTIFPSVDEQKELMKKTFKLIKENNLRDKIYGHRNY